MNSFLKEVTKELYTQYKNRISDNCIVFPNKRAALYFKKYLSEESDKPLWAPKLITINELMCEISGIKATNNIKLIFELYKIYRKIKTSTESFDEFYFWGEIMLSDFNDIDKYLVNPKQIFQNLSALKNIQEQFNYLSPSQIELIMQFWKSFNPDKFSENQEEFVHIWAILSNIYSKFREELKKTGNSYEGMINKDIADKINNNENLKLSNSKYIFIGFNALNECEKTLFNYLKKSNKADFYWDYDNHYLDKLNHEAGRFIRENIKNYPPPKYSNIKFDNINKEKNIKILSTASDIGQAKAIAPLLKTIDNNEISNPNKHAIILTDEQLLVPVLYSIPDTIKKVNVTMGYPLKDTPIYGFIKQIIELQKNIKVNNTNEISFFYKHVISILQHQYINNKDPKAKELINDITKNNKIYLTKNELNISAITSKIFFKIDNHNKISEYLLDILNELFHKLENNNSENQNLEQEYIYHLFITIKQLNEVLSGSNITIQFDTYLNLLDKIIQSINIPFTGEPLSGIQVMGILETRAIDFENLIILSMNEGIFPKISTSMSFIPYNLRRGFNLPAIEYQDSIFSYYFYRLLQRAKNITLIYNSSSDGFQTGEMSRFIHQLKFETKHNIKHYNLSYDISSKPQEKISIHKNANIIAKLNNYLGEEPTRSLSPSAINMYLSCKLKFYFRYIAGLKEQENLLEEIDPLTFGNILHNTMEKLYTPFLGKTISTENIKSIKQNTIEESINEALKKEFNIKKEKKIILSGKNIIIRKILNNYVNQTLKIDSKYAPFEIIGLEDELETKITVEVNNTKININIKGKIDRIDKINNGIRIIDYKTGKAVQRLIGNIEKLFSEESKNRNNAIFQTLLYSKLYYNNFNPTESITPGIYSIRNSHDKNYDYHLQFNKKKVTNYKHIDDEFTAQLSKILAEIFDTQTNFAQTNDIKNCEYCDYKTICNR